MDKTCKSNGKHSIVILDVSSGERVRNTWVIYRKVGNNFEKSMLIPDVIYLGHPEQIKAGDLRAWRFTMSPRPISLLVR